MRGDGTGVPKWRSYSPPGSFVVELARRCDAALGILSVMPCTCPPKPKKGQHAGPMCNRHLLEKALRGEK
jgi:hypothetical protein